MTQISDLGSASNIDRNEDILLIRQNLTDLRTTLNEMLAIKQFNFLIGGGLDSLADNIATGKVVPLMDEVFECKFYDDSAENGSGFIGYCSSTTSTDVVSDTADETTAGGVETVSYTHLTLPTKA